MGTQLPFRKGTQPPPIFGQCPLWPNGWMDEDATWYGSRPWPRPHCIRRVPSCTRKMHSSPPPLFSDHVYCGHGRPSQLYTAELLFKLFVSVTCVRGGIGPPLTTCNTLCNSGFVDNITSFLHDGPNTETGHWRNIHRQSPDGAAGAKSAILDLLRFPAVVT